MVYKIFYSGKGHHVYIYLDNSVTAPSNEINKIKILLRRNK